MGLLTRRGPPDWHPAPRTIRDACRDAARWCDERGVDIAKLAVQYALRLDGIDTVLIGTADPHNMARSLQWIEEDLDEELCGEVLRILEPVRDATWIVGRPENTGDVRGCSVRVARE